MVRLITACVLFICTALSAQTQYETGMNQAFKLWSDGKASEASALFERIASAEKDNWLPSYYVALVNTTESFQTKDKDKINALLTKAQEAEDRAVTIAMDDNAELLVMQAMIHTAWLVADPMTNGMKLTPKINELYAKALALEPNNPRVVLSKAEFEIGSAKYFGQDTAPMCAEAKRAIQLFADFKSDVPFYPKWGLDRAQAIVKECEDKQ